MKNCPIVLAEQWNDVEETPDNVAMTQASDEPGDWNCKLNEE